MHLFQKLNFEDGQDITEYAVMLAVIMEIVVATIRLVGSNANSIFRKRLVRSSSSVFQRQTLIQPMRVMFLHYATERHNP